MLCVILFLTQIKKFSFCPPLRLQNGNNCCSRYSSSSSSSVNKKESKVVLSSSTTSSTSPKAKSASSALKLLPKTSWFTNSSTNLCSLPSKTIFLNPYLTRRTWNFRFSWNHYPSLFGNSSSLTLQGLWPPCSTSCGLRSSGTHAQPTTQAEVVL